MVAKYCFRSLPSISAAILVLLTATLGIAQRNHAPNGRDNFPPVYQRRAFEWMDGQGHWQWRGRHHPPYAIAPPVSSGWFQRPYPYHLDYYKMRYGGSYAPYFGNLYGPPQVVTAPPYYGPYDGDFGSNYPAPLDAQGEYMAPPTPPASESLPSP